MTVYHGLSRCLSSDGVVHLGEDDILIIMFQLYDCKPPFCFIFNMRMQEDLDIMTREQIQRASFMTRYKTV